MDKTADEMAYEKYQKGEYTYEEYADVCDHEECEPELSDGEKATKVLNYLEGLDSTTIINIINPCLDDYQLAMIYDELEKEGVL